MKLSAQKINRIRKVCGEKWDYDDVPAIWKKRGLLTEQEEYHIKINNIFLDKFRKDMEFFEKIVEEGLNGK